MTRTNKNRGFTVIELLIATTIFSLVLVIFLVAFIRIGNMFYKGVNISNTQEVARTVVDDISNDLKFASTPPTIIPADAAGKGYFCIGQHRYKYWLWQQIGAPTTTYGLEREDISGGGCSTAIGGTSPVELLGSGMQLNTISLDNCPNDLCSLSLLIVFYGSDNSVLVSPGNKTPAYNADDATCSEGSISSQFCATATYKGVVYRKI